MQKKVLYIDVPGPGPLPETSALNVAGAGANVFSVKDLPAAIAVLETAGPINIVVSNAPLPELFEASRQHSASCRTVLVTSDTMEKYSAALGGREDVLIDHVIANRNPASWTVDELRVTLQKLIRGEIFGLEKYVAAGTDVKHLTVRSSNDREPFNAQVMEFAEANRLGQYLAKLIYGISEELLMNAIYDAPMAGGKSRYGGMPRTMAVHLEPHEFSELSYCCDGSTFGLSVCDPFGALTREKLFQYLKKVLRRTDSKNLIDKKEGGAGLGLFKILYSSHALIVNVEPRKRTEVMALIDIRHQMRDFSKLTRSVHYFQID